MDRRIKLIERLVRSAFNSVTESSQVRNIYISQVALAILRGYIEEELKEDVEFFIDQQKDCILKSRYRFYCPSISLFNRKVLSELIKKRLSEEQGIALNMFISWIDEKKREIKKDFLKNGKSYKDNSSF